MRKRYTKEIALRAVPYNNIIKIILSAFVCLLTIKGDPIASVRQANNILSPDYTESPLNHVRLK